VRNWRIISTVAAVVFAAIAGVLVWKYLTNADDRAEKNKHLVPVLVAKTQIDRGALFDQQLTDKNFETKQIPEDSLPPNYIKPASDDALLAVYKGKVAAATIYTGTPLVSDQWVAATNIISTVSGAIPKGSQAITMSLDQNHAVGGFVTPGDKVNVILNFATTDAKGDQTGHKVTAFLLPGLKVLAVGSSTVLPQANGGTNTANTTPGASTSTTLQVQPSNLITVQVTPRQAEQIIQGTTLGTVWLSLNPPGFDPGTFKSPTEIVDQINLFDQTLSEAKSRAGLVQDPPPASELPVPSK
jgi:pilus assembly protein CpaB